MGQMLQHVDAAQSRYLDRRRNRPFVGVIAQNDEVRCPGGREAPRPVEDDAFGAAKGETSDCRVQLQRRARHERRLEWRWQWVYHPICSVSSAERLSR